MKLVNQGLRQAFDTLKPGNVLFNFSSHALTALGEGIRISFQPRKLIYVNQSLTFEELLRSLSRNAIPERGVDSIKIVHSSIKKHRVSLIIFLLTKDYGATKVMLSTFRALEFVSNLHTIDLIKEVGGTDRLRLLNRHRVRCSKGPQKFAKFSEE